MEETSKIAFDLDKGIYFEDSGSILEWGCNLNTLKTIDSPEVNDNETVFKWKDKKCFGGHTVNVTIVKDDYHNNKGKLEFVDFEQGRNNPWGVYEKYSKLFKDKFGEPSEFKVDWYDRPAALWNKDKLQIIVGVGERFVEFEVFRIHYGKRFWYLDGIEEK